MDTLTTEQPPAFTLTIPDDEQPDPATQPADFVLELGETPILPEGRYAGWISRAFSRYSQTGNPMLSYIVTLDNGPVGWEHEAVFGFFMLTEAQQGRLKSFLRSIGWLGTFDAVNQADALVGTTVWIDVKHNDYLNEKRAQITYMGYRDTSISADSPF